MAQFISIPTPTSRWSAGGPRLRHPPRRSGARHLGLPATARCASTWRQPARPRWPCCGRARRAARAHRREPGMLAVAEMRCPPRTSNASWSPISPILSRRAPSISWCRRSRFTTSTARRTGALRGRALATTRGRSLRHGRRRDPRRRGHATTPLTDDYDKPIGPNLLDWLQAAQFRCRVRMGLADLAVFVSDR